MCCCHASGMEPLPSSAGRMVHRLPHTRFVRPAVSREVLEGSLAAGLAVASDLLLITRPRTSGAGRLVDGTSFGVDGRVARRHVSHPVPQPIFGGPR